MAPSHGERRPLNAAHRALIALIAEVAVNAYLSEVATVMGVEDGRTMSSVGNQDQEEKGT